MRLLLLPVVLRLQIYRGYANRFVYDLRIFIPESLILRLGMHIMQNKKQPSTTPECADTSKKRKETVNRIKVAEYCNGEAHREQRKDSTHTALQACDNTVASAAPFTPISNQKMNTRSRIIFSSPYQLRTQAFFVLIAHGRLYS